MASRSCGHVLLLMLVLGTMLLLLDVAESRRWRKKRGQHQEESSHWRQRQMDRHHRGGRARHHHAGRDSDDQWPWAFFRRLGFDSLGRNGFDFGWNPFEKHRDRWEGFDFDFGWNPYERQRDWWEGPHVCESEEDSNSGESESSLISHHHKLAMQVCEESETAYRCTSTVQSPEGVISKTKLFQCCHGFSRTNGEFGCPEKLQLNNLLDTAQTLGLKDLLQAVRTVDLDEELARGNFTLFAPKDGAFPLPTGPGLVLQKDQEHPRGALMISRPLLDKLEDDLQAVLLGHVVNGPRRASSFADEELLETASPYDSTIRINFYSRPEKLTTANCVKVTSTDHMASNGIIHTVDKVLPTVTSSLLDIIQKEEDFSFLKTALGRANLVPEFKGEGKFTLFAPTNAAFKNLEPALLDRLLRGNPKCLEKVLKQHVLPHVICSTVIQGRAKSRNILRNYINLTRTEDNKVFVNDAQVVRSDIMATNGVLHVIDAVLIPEDAMDLVSVAEKKELTSLVALLLKARVAPTLQKAENLTVFAPTNEAFQSLPPDLVNKLFEFPDQEPFLKRVLNYHVVPVDLNSRQLYNNRLLDTLDDDRKIRINEYSSFPFGQHHVMTAQCVTISQPSMDACNGIVHIVDKVLIPPAGNVVDVLAADSRYNTLVRLLKTVGLADALQGEGPFTIFAPTDKAFKELGKKKLESLENNVDELTKVLKMHVFSENLCCAGIFNNPWWRHQQIHTMNGHSLFLTRNHHGQAVVNDITIASCDNMATNGVVHGIDTVLLPKPKPWYMFP